MGYVVRHSTHAGHQGKDPVQHSIEVGAQIVELISTARAMHSRIEVSFENGAAGAVGRNMRNRVSEIATEYRAAIERLDKYGLPSVLKTLLRL